MRAVITIEMLALPPGGGLPPLRAACRTCCGPAVSVAETPSDPQPREALRREARARRRALPAAERHATSLAIARHLAATGWLHPGMRLAAYAALPEEIDVSACLRLALSRGCGLWLPRIEAARAGRMVFAPVTAALRLNAFGIPEPASPERLGGRWMQLILVPLVAFDGHGARLGMGGGFYDRALAWRRWRTTWAGPRLVGIAHSSQRVGRIAAQPHDIRLDAVITEQGLTRFRKDPR